MDAIAIPAKWLKNALATHERAQRCLQEAEPSSLLGRALIVARRIDEPFDRAVALGDISRYQAEMSDRRGAANTARDALAAALAIHAERWRDRAMDFIARSQAEIGDQSVALGTASRIHDASVRTAALVDIAEAQAKASDVAGALATARDIDDAPSRATALAYIAEAQAKAGDVAGALATARDIDDASARAAALVPIAEAQAKSGDVGGALATARGIADTLWGAAALARIACAQAELGDRQGAADTFRDAVAVARAGALDQLGAILHVQAKTGDVATALEAAEAIKDDALRAMALAGVAAALAATH